MDEAQPATPVSLPGARVKRPDADVAAIFDEHYRYVLRLATSLTGDPALAEDVAQDVFVAVINGIDNFRGDSMLRTWLYQVTIRIAGRQLARRKRGLGAHIDPDDFPGIASADSGALLVELVAAIAKLPLGSRTVLSLVTIEGLSHAAAGEVLGVPPGTIGSRLHTARRQLARMLRRESHRQS